MGQVLPPSGNPSTKRKKTKNPLKSLLDPTPKGPGLPVSHKQDQQKVLINHVLKGKAPIPFHRSTLHQMGKPTQKELNALGNNGKPKTVPITPVAHVVMGGGGSNHTQAAQRIKNRNTGQATSKGDRVVTGNSGGSTSGGGNGKHPLLRRARETVAAQIGPQLAEYRQQIKQARSSSNRQGAELADLYRRLGVQINSNQSQGDAANASALSSIGSNYDKLNQQLTDTYSGATGATNSELARLGIQEAGPAATSKLTSDQGFLTGLAGIDKANALSNSTSQGQSFDNLITMLGSQAKLSGTQKRATALQTAANAISELRSQKGALAATRRGAVDALFHQLKDAKTQRETDAAQQSFMNQIAAGKLGIEQGNLGVSQGRLGVEQGKLSLDAANSSATNDLKKAQALKYIRDAKAPYTTPGGSTTPKGYGAGLHLLSSTKTGNNAAAKQAQKTATSVYKTYYLHHGNTAITALTANIKNGSAHDFLNLPRDLQGAVIDALTMAGAK